MAVRLMVVSLLLPTALLALAQAEDAPALEASSAIVDVSSNTVPSHPTEAKRERLRNFFERRREQRVKPGDVGQGGKGQKRSKPVRNRRVRPQLRQKQEPEEPESVEERVETSVSVSSSVSTSSKITKRIQTLNNATSVNQEEPSTDNSNRTTRKRFRLIKNPRINQDALLEKLLANIDLKNDIKPEDKPGRRPSRFRPSIRRDQIRQKSKSALKLKASRIRIRKPSTATEKTIPTTPVQTQEQEVEAATDTFVLLGQSEEHSNSDRATTVVTEGYAGVTEAAQEDFVTVDGNKEMVDEITTERQSIPLNTTSKRFGTDRKVNRAKFFRRNNPRRFGFGQKPSLTTFDKKLKPTFTEFEDDRAIIENNLPKEANLKSGAVPVQNRLKTNKPESESVQQIISKPKPVETSQLSILPQPLSNDIEPEFKMIVLESQPTLKLNNRQNQINQNRNSLGSPNSIVQPALLKPTKFKQPSLVSVPETQRSIAGPKLQTCVKPIKIQSIQSVPETFQENPAQPMTRETLFPKFKLPDFFRVPFAALQAQAPSTPGQQPSNTGNNAGALFIRIGQPQGTVQGHPRATNLNIRTGSYSVGW